MARPLPVNMLLAGTGAVLLVSGIGGESVGKVLQGSFGKLQFNPKAGEHLAQGEQPEQSGASAMAGEGATSFAASTVAAPPAATRHRPKPTKQQEAEGIAKVLTEIYPGVRNPTHAQIEHARELYRIETGQIVP